MVVCGSHPWRNWNKWEDPRWLPRNTKSIILTFSQQALSDIFTNMTLSCNRIKVGEIKVFDTVSRADAAIAILVLYLCHRDNISNNGFTSSRLSCPIHQRNSNTSPYIIPDVQVICISGRDVTTWHPIFVLVRQYDCSDIWWTYTQPFRHRCTFLYHGACCKPRTFCWCAMLCRQRRKYVRNVVGQSW